MVSSSIAQRWNRFQKRREIPQQTNKVFNAGRAALAEEPEGRSNRVSTQISQEQRKSILGSFIQKYKRRKPGLAETSENKKAFQLEGENDDGDYEYELDPERLETRWRSTSSVGLSESPQISYGLNGSCMECGESVPIFMLEERILEVDSLTLGICSECYPEFLQFLEDAVDDETATRVNRPNWALGVPRRTSTRRSSAPGGSGTLGMRLFIANPSNDEADEPQEQPQPQRPPARQRSRSEATAPAYPSLRTDSTGTQECTICGDSYPTHSFVPATTSCSHSITYCRTCLATWITSSLSTLGWDSIRCPLDSCKEPLSATDIQLHADKLTLEAYSAAATKSALSDLPNFQWCLEPSCNSGQIHESDGPIFTCVECGFKSCVVHGVRWHEGETCIQYSYRTDKSLRKREEVASLATVAQTTRRCPKRSGGCGAPIEKNEGCDHMKCRKCQFEFCWICGAAHEPIKQHGNSKHERWCKHWRRG